MAQILIEAACETTEDARAAAAGGADRLELCAALDLGGLTPSWGFVRDVRTDVPLPVAVMLRPRPGDFVYSDADVKVMARDLESFKHLTPSAYVFGLLTPDAEIDTDRCAELIRLAQPTPCVFHRAFDRARNLRTGLEVLIQIGFQRVLTSGRAPTAVEGIPNLRELQAIAAGRIEILPGGGIRADTAADVIQGTGCRQVHASFAEEIPESSDRGRAGYPPRNRLSQALVAATRAAVDQLV